MRPSKRSAQCGLNLAVQQSGADTPDSDQGRGLKAKPAVSGDVDGQCIIPEKTELKYPNLGSTPRPDGRHC